LGFVATLFLLGLFFLGAGILAIQVFGLVLPGVKAGDASLAWKTRAQAAQEINRYWNEERGLLVTDGSRSWSTTPGFFGLWVDPAAMAETAYQVGRTGSGENALAAEIERILRGEELEIQPVVTWNAEYAQAQLAQWAPMINLPAQEASLALEGGQLTVSPAQDGATVDIQQSLMGLAANPVGVMQSGVLQLSMTRVEPRVRDVSAAMAQAQALISRPIQVRAYDPVSNESLDWTIPPEVVSTWLRIDGSPDGPVVSLDAGLAGPYLSSLGDHLSGDRTLGPLPDSAVVSAALQSGAPIPLNIQHRSTEYVVQPGDTLLKIGWKVGIPFWRVTQANPGLDPERLTAGQTLVIPSKDELLPLPVVPNKRILISIGQQRMRVFQDGSQIREFVISTGIDRSPTQPGIFQIQTHEPSAYASVWDLTMPNFLGIYEAWPGFMNGIHGLPTLSSGTRLWGSILGRPASYGCIILDLDDAEWLYSWAENGVVVEIQA